MAFFLFSILVGRAAEVQVQGHTHTHTHTRTHIGGLKLKLGLGLGSCSASAAWLSMHSPCFWPVPLAFSNKAIHHNPYWPPSALHQNVLPAGCVTGIIGLVSLLPS